MLDSEKLPKQTINHRVSSILVKTIKTQTEVEDKFLFTNYSRSNDTDFWTLWVQYQDYLYQCCFIWMKGNPTEAQEALSRASLKAWEKWQNYAGKIINPKAWLAQLTHNLCMDMHRERSREANNIESLEAIAVAEDKYVSSNISSPESAILSRERDGYIRRAIDSLPNRLHTPFILRYYQEMSYQEIAQQLALSNENVRKRVQQARTILKKRLYHYFSGLDDAQSLASCLNPHPWKPQLGQEIVTPILEEPASEQAKSSNCKTSVSVGCTPKSIDYKVTTSCLEVLPHTWYSSLNSLGWS